MEEPCDWAVCSEAAVPGPLAPPSSRTERKRKKKEKEEKRSDESVGNSPCHQSKPVRSRPAPAAVDGCGATIPPAGGATLQATPTRRELQEALPKIPPLSSFKSRREELVGLDQAEQLFHRFITAGSGRSVEIVREFRGHDQGEEQEEEQGKEGHRETIMLPDDSPLALKTPGKWSHFLPRPTTEPRDDGEQRASVEKPAPPAVGGEMECISTSSYTSASTCTSSAKQRLPQKTGMAGTASCPSANQKPSGKQSSRNRGDQERERTGGQPIRERRGRAWRPGVCDDYEEEEEEEENGHQEEKEAWSHEADWRSSYRAWRDFYSSFSSPAGQPEYYSCYTAAHHWMAAYRMNVVYMEELLKN